MKRVKKLTSMVITMIMLMAMTVTVSAEEKGSITINNAVVGQRYSVYQILELESYNEEAGAYAYKASSEWETWLRTQTAYVSFDDQGYVTWVEGADAAEFAKLAQVEAEAMDETAGPIEAASATVKFTGLDLGYYLVDTTLGALCSLDTTNPDAEMKEKNETPVIEKEVQEDSTLAWGDTNDADISQTVDYRATITVQKGAENYIMHDKMEEGLTYQGVTAVEIGEEPVSVDNYQVVVPGTCVEKCTFEVVFDNDFIASLEDGTQIVVYYSAVLNEKAVIGLPGNDNDVWLQYGDLEFPTYTPIDTTTTYTWDMGVLKFANSNKENVLAGAKFVLLNNDKTEVAEVVDGKIAGWEKVEDVNLEDYALTTGADGKISITGLDSDTYYLREIEAPAGYNKLADDVEIVIVGMDNGGETVTYTTVVAEVNNNSGTELPDTGGIGTKIFYYVGGVLVALAAVVFVTRKRMSAE